MAKSLYMEPGSDAAQNDRRLEGLEGEEVIERGRDLTAQPLAGRELVGEAIAATGFLACAIAMAVFLEAERSLSIPLAFTLVAAHVLAARIKFEVGAGFTVPTQLVFVPMLLLLPTPVVPLLVALGNLLGDLPDYLHGRRHPQRAIIALADSWYSVAPALILVAFGAQTPAIGDWPIYIAALFAQSVSDFAISSLREWYELGRDPRVVIRDWAWISLVDWLLAPIALLAMFTSLDDEFALLLVLPVVGLLYVFAHERQRGLNNALQLRNAYLGTTILLGDLIEDDDEYTGLHSKTVVSLSLQVADEMGLSPAQRRRTEFAALLHDVGKIAVSKDIINKPGPLSSEERAVMQTHTIEGERMLQRVGGFLDEVGRIVRASHEHWNGSGYPDGLSGEEIPVEARIVCCCDAFNAMTTTRSYRTALSTDVALEEVRRNAGTQFDPHVAEVLVRLVEQGAIQDVRATTLPAEAHAAPPTPTRA
jgi:putative nucleotidyltransferase with HDIG domain